MCESVLFGVPLVVRPTACWKLEWEELETNQQHFTALCKTLQDRVSHMGTLDSIAMWDYCVCSPGLPMFSTLHIRWKTWEDLGMRLIELSKMPKWSLLVHSIQHHCIHFYHEINRHELHAYFILFMQDHVLLAQSEHTHLTMPTFCSSPPPHHSLY